MSSFDQLWRYRLKQGPSDHPRRGACLLDAVSWLEYGSLGDNPGCVCPEIACYGRFINDGLPDYWRQKLIPYIPRLPGTVDPEAEPKRLWALFLHLTRWMLPPLLRQVGKDAEANQLVRVNDALSARLVLKGLLVTDGDLRYLPDWQGAGHLYQVSLQNSQSIGIDGMLRAVYCALDECRRSWPPRRRAVIYKVFIQGLDVMLAIGKQAEPVPVARYNDALMQFGLARTEKGYV